jgi:hypothetical protein
MKKTFNLLSHKGNVNQNYIEIFIAPSFGYHQENKQQQMLVSMQGQGILPHSHIVQSLWNQYGGSSKNKNRPQFCQTKNKIKKEVKNRSTL